VSKCLLGAVITTHTSPVMHIVHLRAAASSFLYPLSPCCHEENTYMRIRLTTGRQLFWSKLLRRTKSCCCQQGLIFKMLHALYILTLS